MILRIFHALYEIGSVPKRNFICLLCAGESQPKPRLPRLSGSTHPKWGVGDLIVKIRESERNLFDNSLALGFALMLFHATHAPSPE
jgi:hypothetical protein